MLDKEVKRNPALAAMLGGADEDKTERAPKVVKEKKAHDPRKANPRAYERNRGRGGTKPMSYYIPPELIKLLNIKKYIIYYRIAGNICVTVILRLQQFSFYCHHSVLKLSDKIFTFLCFKNSCFYTFCCFIKCLNIAINSRICNLCNIFFK